MNILFSSFLFVSSYSCLFLSCDCWSVISVAVAVSLKWQRSLFWDVRNRVINWFCLRRFSFIFFFLTYSLSLSLFVRRFVRSMISWKFLQPFYRQILFLIQFQRSLTVEPTLTTATNSIVSFRTNQYSIRSRIKTPSFHLFSAPARRFVQFSCRNWQIAMTRKCRKCSKRSKRPSTAVHTVKNYRIQTHSLLRDSLIFVRLVQNNATFATWTRALTCSGRASQETIVSCLDQNGISFGFSSDSLNVWLLVLIWRSSIHRLYFVYRQNRTTKIGRCVNSQRKLTESQTKLTLTSISSNRERECAYPSRFCSLLVYMRACSRPPSRRFAFLRDDFELCFDFFVHIFFFFSSFRLVVPICCVLHITEMTLSRCECVACVLISLALCAVFIVSITNRMRSSFSFVRCHTILRISFNSNGLFFCSLLIVRFFFLKCHDTLTAIDFSFIFLFLCRIKINSDATVCLVYSQSNVRRLSPIIR